MDNWQSFLWLVTKTTILQLIALFGLFFAFGLALSHLQTKTHELYRRVFGWNGIVFTAWFGTPFHELGHVFFAKLFRHQIEAVSLFEPNKETGSLGHVEHSFNPLSLYQRIGNFFIGAAPLLFGLLILSLFVVFLLPNGYTILSPLATSDSSSILSLGKGLMTALSGLFSVSNLTSWNFWVFLYISFCVAAHMAPSKRDRKNMWGGLAWVTVILLVINLLFLSIGIDATTSILKLQYILGFIVGLFLYAMCIAVLHYFLAYLILHPLYLLKNVRKQ